MSKPEALREPMFMPDPHFPIKMQLTRINENGRMIFNHHWHSHLEILYVISGTALFECNGVPYEVREGGIVIVNSNDIHYGSSLSDELHYHVLITDLSLLHSQRLDSAEAKFITPITQNHILFQNHITDDRELQDNLLALAKELEDKQIGYELSVKSYLYRIMTVLLRSYVDKVLNEDQYMLRIRSLDRFTQVFQYIEEHNAEQIRVERLAGLAGLSRFHFSRLFKELTNQTLTEYIRSIRLKKAEYLLRNSAMNISEIAIATGFHDIYYFSRIYKAHKAIPPSEARKQWGVAEH